MEEKIKINFCKCCKRNSEGCMNLEVRNIDSLKVYRCTNYESNIELPEYMKYIKYSFYDDEGNHIAILKTKVSENDIFELRRHFDYVKYQA